MNTMSKAELKDWLAGSPESCPKELKWQLYDFGQYFEESVIIALQEELLREACRCPDDSGSCPSCLELYNK